MKTKHLHAISVVLLLLVVGTQPALGTKSIPSDTSIGTWDSDTRIYTLTTDVYETIQIDEDNLILDGAGHKVAGSGTGNGIFLSERTGVIIKNLNIQGFNFGIYLVYSEDNTLTCNIVSSNNVGIGLNFSNGNVVCDNTANLNDLYGISLIRSCNNNIMTGNAANSNGYYGIHLYDSNNSNTLSSNTASNNNDGIIVSNSSGNKVTDSTTNSNKHAGVIFIGSTENTVTYNTALDNSSSGIFLTGHCSNNIVADNMASNNIYGVRIWASSYNQISNNNLSGNETAISAGGPGYQGNRYLNNDLSNSTSFAIGISDDSEFELFGNDFTNSYSGISLTNVNGVSLSNIDLSTIQSGTGVHLTGVTNSSFSNIIVSGGTLGIYLLNSSNNMVTDNTTLNNTQGISLRNSSQNILTNNTTLNNSYMGIFVSASNNNSLSNNTISNNDYGIYTKQSSNNTVTGNTVNSNTTHGIAISPSCNNNILTDNMVSNNGSGIMLWASDDNQIYNNNFIANAIQASVGGSSGNIFNLDKPIGGNYWSDWTSPDGDSDGFVDFPYVFSGGQDDLPWAVPDGWSCRDPGDMIQELADQVMALNLQHGISNSLDAKLDAALQAFEDINENNDIAAINTLEAFIDAVEAQRGSKITDSDADALITKAQKIIDCLGST